LHEDRSDAGQFHAALDGVRLTRGDQPVETLGMSTDEHIEPRYRLGEREVFLRVLVRDRHQDLDALAKFPDRLFGRLDGIDELDFSDDGTVEGIGIVLLPDETDQTDPHRPEVFDGIPLADVGILRPYVGTEKREGGLLAKAFQMGRAEIEIMVAD